MANEVYANGREISCKAGMGQVTAAFPDVCLTPPPPPAGPIPIPYPNFSFSSDTTQGSKSVKISGKEVMLKDKSYFKKCTGDEPATKAQGMGVVTHTIQGKVYFIAWSMDVEVEGENVVRHLDMTTSNHASPMANNSVPMVETEGFGFDDLSSCQGQPERCRLKSYDEGCPGGKTPHHVVPDHCSKQPGKGGLRYQGCSNITHGDAPCICVTGAYKHSATPAGNLMQHGRIHDIIDPIEDAQPNNKWPYSEVRDQGAVAAAEVTGCDAACIADQCDRYYKDRCGVKDGTMMRADSGGKKKVKGLKPSARCAAGFG
jgi:hypothetical protein